MAEKKMKLGLIVGEDGKRNLNESFEQVKDIGVPTCQISCLAETMVDKINPMEVAKKADKMKIEISSFFLVFDGQAYDNKNGPATMGFVPLEFRKKRMDLAKKYSDMVRDMGVKSITSHVGFIPRDPKDPLYKSFIPVMREFILHCKKNKQMFCFETGQELPSVLLRTIKDLDCDNVGINLDPANLVLYGMANPIDAVQIFGKYVKGFHAKDGVWPNRDESLGHETALGEGMVDFKYILPELKKMGFKGPVTIEREITGPQQKEDILKAIKLLSPYL